MSIFVDGKYQSSQAVFAERAGKDGFGNYEVNLGQLAKGPHHVEIRCARFLAGDRAACAVVRNAAVGESAGTSAEIARFAPLLATRRTRVYNEGPRTDLRPSLTHTDTPLVMRAEVIGEPTGIHMVGYQVTLSDEDSGTPDAPRLQQYGRTTDDEWCYRVLVDGTGKKVTPQALAALKAGKGDKATQAAFDAFVSSLAAVKRLSPADAKALLAGPEIYQYGNDGLIRETRHQVTAFDGRHVGERPVIRVNSGNNNFAAVKAGEKLDTAVWSPAIHFDGTRVEKSKSGQVLRTGHLSDKDVLRTFPWVEQLTRKETRRED